ncbi:MAG: hypothetical protein ACQET8_14820 [Bacillota bacterium]
MSDDLFIIFELEGMGFSFHFLKVYECGSPPAPQKASNLERKSITFETSKKQPISIKKTKQKNTRA